MRHKRIAAAAAREQAAAAERAQELDVVPWLRRLGFGAREACRAAALCQGMADASLEERVRVALSYFHVRGTRVVWGTSRDGGVTRPFGSVGAGP